MTLDGGFRNQTHFVLLNDDCSIRWSNSESPSGNSELTTNENIECGTMVEEMTEGDGLVKVIRDVDPLNKWLEVRSLMINLAKQR